MKYSSGLIIPLGICLIFFITYSTLGLVRHAHYLSGYDIAVMDQAVWKYSKFKAPVSTNHAYPFTSILYDHVELIFALISPIYWIYDNINSLILLQSLSVASSAFAVYLLARFKNIKLIPALAIMLSYILFYGIQFAVWSDVHSVIFGLAFCSWFLYFLETKRNKLALIFGVLAIICKEDIALTVFIITAISFIFDRNKVKVLIMFISVIYLFAIYFVYFGYLVPGGYRFQSQSGLFSNLSLANFYNTYNKQEVWKYTLLAFGFLPLLTPLYLLPLVVDLTKYFVIANDIVTSGQSLFGHYRAFLALLGIWPVIVLFSKVRRLNSLFGAAYLLFFVLLLQYQLHLPLSYLSKKWFWTQSPAVASINRMLKSIPINAQVVTPVNISPHLSHRDYAFIFWPLTITPKDNSACLQTYCEWLRWPGNPQYLLIDKSTEWDARFILTDNKTFQRALVNLEKGGVIRELKKDGTTVLYRIIKKS